MRTSKNMIELESLINAHTDGYSLEQDFYLAPEIFDHDMTKLLSRRWLLVDHESRIPSTGDYFRFEVGVESIIIIRDEERQVNAFFNVCRHRGSRICSDLEGNQADLPAPTIRGLIILKESYGSRL